MWYIHVKYSLNREISYVAKQHKLFTVVFTSENQMLRKAARTEQWFWKLKAGGRGGTVEGQVFRHACGETVLEICCTVVSQQLCAARLKIVNMAGSEDSLQELVVSCRVGSGAELLVAEPSHQLRSNTATHFALCEWETGVSDCSPVDPRWGDGIGHTSLACIC